MLPSSLLSLWNLGLWSFLIIAEFPSIWIKTIDSDIWFDMEKVNLVYRAEGIHKGIFKILEKEVLPDLLKALKENS